MGMSLADGGHLTHGSPVNASGKLYKFVPYGVNPDGFIDYDGLERKAREIKPKLIVAGASAYPRIIDFERIGALAKEIGAYFMVDMAHIAGLVAAGLHPSPVPYADIVTTTTHKTLRGRGAVLSSRPRSCARNKQSDIPRQSGRSCSSSLPQKAVSSARLSPLNSRISKILSQTAPLSQTGCSQGSSARGRAARITTLSLSICARSALRARSLSTGSTRCISPPTRIPCPTTPRSPLSPAA